MLSLSGQTLETDRTKKGFRPKYGVTIITRDEGNLDILGKGEKHATVSLDSFCAQQWHNRSYGRPDIDHSG
jgi:hypothetical protein